MDPSEFMRIGENRYERTCPHCHGRRIISRTFDELRWHCVLCGALSTPAQRAATQGPRLPCGHDRMYGDRDEPMDIACQGCNGHGIIVYSFLEMVEMGLIVPDHEPVIIADARIAPAPQDTTTTVPLTRALSRSPYRLKPPKSKTPKQKKATPSSPSLPPTSTSQRSPKPPQPPPVPSEPDSLATALCAKLPRHQPLTQRAIEDILRDLPLPNNMGRIATQWERVGVILRLEQQGVLVRTGRHYVYAGAMPSAAQTTRLSGPPPMAPPVQPEQVPPPQKQIEQLAHVILAQLTIGRHVSTRKIDLLVGAQGIPDAEIQRYVKPMLAYLSVRHLIDRPEKHVIVRRE